MPFKRGAGTQAGQIPGWANSTQPRVWAGVTIAGCRTHPRGGLTRCAPAVSTK